MMNKVSVFGREPAFWIGLVEAVLALLLAWNTFGLTTEQVGGVMAVVTGVFGFYTAYVTRQTLLGVGVGLAKSVIIVMATFGLNFTENQTAALIGVVTIALGAFNRTQTTPVPPGDPQRGLVLDN